MRLHDALKFLALFALVFVWAEEEKEEIKDLSHGFGTDIEWIDFGEASELSERLKKPVFVLIHKTWCGACKQLKNSFNTSPKRKEFIQLTRKFVMVNLEDDEEPEDDKFAPDGRYIPRLYFTKGEDVLPVTNKNYPKNLYYFPQLHDVIKAMNQALKLYNEKETAESNDEETKKEEKTEDVPKNESEKKEGKAKDSKNSKETKSEEKKKTEAKKSEKESKKKEDKTESKEKKEEKPKKDNESKKKDEKAKKEDKKKDEKTKDKKEDKKTENDKKKSETKKTDKKDTKKSETKKKDEAECPHAKKAREEKEKKKESKSDSKSGKEEKKSKEKAKSNTKKSEL